MQVHIIIFSRTVSFATVAYLLHNIYLTTEAYRAEPKYMRLLPTPTSSHQTSQSLASLRVSFVLCYIFHEQTQRIIHPRNVTLASLLAEANRGWVPNYQAVDWVATTTI